MAAQPTVPLRADAYGLENETATPLAIAHGLLGSAANWRTAARRFGRARPTLSADMRNHGESPWGAAMDYETMGADLLALIDREFGRPAILLGHSMGGKAAMAAALAAPEKIAALIVVDIAPLAYEHPEHREIAQAMLTVDLKTLERRGDAEKALASAAPDPAMRAFLLQNLVFEGEERVARWRPNLAAIEKAVDDVTGWPSLLDGRRYEGPTLSIRGGQSKYVSADGLAALRRSFPALEEVEIAEAGHWPHAEAPGEFLEACDSFLLKLP